MIPQNKNSTGLMVVNVDTVKSIMDTMIAMKTQILQLEEMRNKLECDLRKVRLRGLNETP